MSVLESDWRRSRRIEDEDRAERERLRAEAGLEPDADADVERVPILRARSRPGLFRRTVRRFS
jgi:hypothetical protein